MFKITIHYNWANEVRFHTLEKQFDEDGFYDWLDQEDYLCFNERIDNPYAVEPKYKRVMIPKGNVVKLELIDVE